MSKKGLLISPEFPVQSFWSYKHILREYVNRKTPFPPLGLLTFAAMLDQEKWDLNLVDLNVEAPNQRTLTERIEEADAVFVGAMSIQKDSLVDLLNTTQGTTTPFFLGGPMASTYRDTILHPETDSNRILHQGLDVLVWGEAERYIEEIEALTDENLTHSSETPRLLIPEKVASEPSGSRKYLRDTEIFKPLDNIPLPLWDLINIDNYKGMLMQTTAGCKFRCDFCDIVQFNGGFARAKDKAAVQKEMQAIYNTGFRGNIFTVDDNFVSNPEAMVNILEGMTDFQRRHDYPFTLITQASVDLGSENFEYLIPSMAEAGFSSVFLGIENPDSEALKGMNKVQNVKTNPETTIGKLHAAGIEVTAGFIYGADGDTRKTAKSLITFIKNNALFTAMTGKLTPMPHTPLHRNLLEAGRLHEEKDTSNNTEGDLTYDLVSMTKEEFQEGYREIMNLFSEDALRERSQDLMRRIKSNLFYDQSPSIRRIQESIRTLAISITRQGLGWGEEGRSYNPEYFNSIRNALRLDKELGAEATEEERILSRFWNNLTSRSTNPIEVEREDISYLQQMLDYGRGGLVRHYKEMELPEITDLIGKARDSIERGVISLETLHPIYEASTSYVKSKKRLFRFPGLKFIKTIEHAVMGEHYRLVAEHIRTTYQDPPVSQDPY